MNTMNFQQPHIPVIQNTSASINNTIPDIKTALCDQLFSPVRWVESIETLSRGFAPEVIIECGPGKVLAGLNKRIMTIPTISIEDALHV
jgi:[acyl-carrier-protein] S-malonyltransferase